MLHNKGRGFLLVSDIDGTLLDKGVIPKYSADMIEDFKANGGLFTIATGRSVDSARRYVEAVAPNCPVIVLNGAAAYDYEAERFTWQSVMPESSRRAVREILDRFPHMGAEIHIGRDLYVVNVSDEVLDHVGHEDLKYTVCGLDDVPDGWHKVLFADYESEVNALREYAAQIKTDGYYFVDTYVTYLEMLGDGANKGTALLKTADSLGIDRAKACAIGDYYNDREMIAEAGIGAYTLGAPEELRQTADYVACACGDGAVGDFINYLYTL